MTATGQAIVDDDGAAAMAAIERDLLFKEHMKIKEHVAQLQETVRQLQSTIDSQCASLQRLVAVVDRLSASPVAPAAMSATAASSAASAPAASAVAGAPTTVGTVPAHDTVAAQGTVDAAEWQPAGACSTVQASRLPGFQICIHCRKTTSVCEDGTLDANVRAACLKMQRWTKSSATRNWRCGTCCPWPAPLERWPDTCWESHGAKERGVHGGGHGARGGVAAPSPLA